MNSQSKSGLSTTRLPILVSPSAAVMLRACLLLMLALAPNDVFVAGIDPAYARNITIYHVNPVSFGPYPINMNTADAVGDLYFDMYQVGGCW